MANYYRKFIPNNSKLASPLSSLLKKDVKFEWSELCQNSFDSIKQALTSTPVLAYLNTEKPFILTCDASDYAIGYTISKFDNCNKKHVIAYGGKSLTSEERKWSTTAKECYAVLKGIEQYHTYLANAKFTVITDHKSLVWLMTAKHNGRLERWSLRLQEYNFEIIHRPGRSNVVADAHSRRQYEENDTTQVCEVKMDSDENMKENPELAMVTLYYKQEHVYEVSALNAEQLQTTVDDSDTLKIAR